MDNFKLPTYSSSYYNNYALEYSNHLYEGYNRDIIYKMDCESIPINHNEIDVRYDEFIDGVNAILDGYGLSLKHIGRPISDIKNVTLMLNKDAEPNKSSEDYFIVQGWSKIIGSRFMVGISSGGKTNPNGVNMLEVMTPPSYYLHDNPLYKEVYDRFIEAIYSSLKSSAKKNRKVTKPLVISMLNKSDGGFYFENFDISVKTDTVSEYDLFYGDGFEVFHESLTNAIVDGRKGLVLFHGEPGTGKTFYIKTLIQCLQERDENILVVYTPTAMIDQLDTPAFVSLLNEYSQKEIILLIEDAENVLADRDSGNFESSISNILNSTSGILNDIFGLTIIATFNTDLKNIDTALLRNERLLARKQFNMIKKDRAIEIAKYLKIDESLLDSAENKGKTEFSVADITSNIADHQILMHDYEEVTKKIGF